MQTKATRPIILGSESMEEESLLIQLHVLFPARPARGDWSEAS